MEYNNIKYVEVLERLIKITKKFRVVIVIGSHHLQKEEKQLVVYDQQYVSQFLSTKVLSYFSTSIFSTLQPQLFCSSWFCRTAVLQNIFHWPRLIYDPHLDNSGLEHKFWLRNIFCSIEEELPYFFLSLSKAGQSLFDGYELLSAHTVQKIISLRNMQLQ